MKIGSSDISKIYLGSEEISKIYLGSNLVWGGGSALRYDAEVEYLQTDGNQYLTLPVVPSEATDAIEIEFMRTANTNQQRFCFANGEITFQVYVNGNGRLAYSRAGSWTAMSSSNNSQLGLVKHNIKVDFFAKKCTLDTYATNITSTTKNATNNLVLFGKYGSNATIQALIYSVKFWRSGTLQYDLIPVRKNGVGYFYDRVNGVLYPNEGTGCWTIGYDKYSSLSDYTQVDYIENNTFTATSPYIDTGITNNGSLGAIDMEMVVKWNTIDSSKRQLHGANLGIFFGCDGGIYKSSNVDMNLPTPSTTTYDTVNFTDSYSVAPQHVGTLGLFDAIAASAKAHTATTYKSSCKLKAFKIWVSNVLVRDYVPVLHPANVYGMFDKVENKFYPSANSGTFTGGYDS